ncbi:MAG: amidoligase family protein [Gammaproteobacteria bacterium]|nr:amidoligase family protein [Gammaproteobacteria bacterium]
MPLSRMQLIDQIRESLVEAKARGTSESVLYGFGVHINPDLPATDAGTLLAHMRAYGLLYDWISQQSKVDWSRRIGPYIKPWPDEYLQLILQPDYAPSRPQLAEDYVRHIPSRNHALDMLPVLVHLEGTHLLQHLKEPDLIKPRPALSLPAAQLPDRRSRVAHCRRVALLGHDRTAGGGQFTA